MALVTEDLGKQFTDADFIVDDKDVGHAASSLLRSVPASTTPELATAPAPSHVVMPRGRHATRRGAGSLDSAGTRRRNTMVTTAPAA
jgi:hypothetical protein